MTVHHTESVDSLRLCAETFGDRSSAGILFIPGMTGSSEVWDKNFRALSDGFRLIMIDALGFGGSPKPEIEYSIEDHTNAIHATVEAEAQGRVHVVGHSMGALLALAYASRFPERVNRLVLISLPWFRDEHEARERIAKTSLFNRLLAMDTPLAHVVCAGMCHLRPILMTLMPYLMRNVPAAVARDSLRHTWISYSRTLRHVIFEARTDEWVRSVHGPLEFVHGTRDDMAPIENVRRSVVAMPNVRLVELDAGHNVIFTHGAALAAEIRSFLTSGE